MGGKRFPVMIPFGLADQEAKATCPRSVPWALVRPHRQQAWENHEQSLRTLGRRGGLDPTELVAVLEDRAWHKMPLPDAIERLKALIDAAD